MSEGNWLDGLDAPDARKWEYEDGDQLVGEVVGLGTFDGDYGKSRTVTIMPDAANSTEDGKNVTEGEALIFYASSKIAADEMDAKDPQIGDQLAIRYKGTRQGKDTSSNPYKVFVFAIKRSDANSALDKAEAGQKADW